jgi:endonuclease YncB( thermonuclease family)
MKKYPLAAALLLASFAIASSAATLEGRIVGVSDGDTVTLLDADNRQHKIRLAGIDAPEKEQPFGHKSKEALSRLVFGQDVVVEYKKKDRYGRIVGHVAAEGRDANLDLLREGAAWVYRQYLGELPEADRQRYLDAERQARTGELGLWRDPDPAPPWQWRKARREAKA